MGLVKSCKVGSQPPPQCLNAYPTQPSQHAVCKVATQTQPTLEVVGQRGIYEASHSLFAKLTTSTEFI